jgi:polysaccharide export outer membrane protein
VHTTAQPNSAGHFSLRLAIVVLTLLGLGVGCRSPSSRSPAQSDPDPETASDTATMASESPPAGVDEQEAQPATEILPDGSEPLIRPGHVLMIEVSSGGMREFAEPEKRVSTLGTISLPLVDTVTVNGLTLHQLARNLQKMYAGYIRDPVVDVAFQVDDSPGAVSPWGTVTVLGRVKLPGRINIPPTQDLTLSMAIQLAGGYDNSANDQAIRVTRVRPNAPPELINVDLRSAASKGQIQNDIPLRDGDIVYVPEKVF